MRPAALRGDCFESSIMDRGQVAHLQPTSAAFTEAITVMHNAPVIRPIAVSSMLVLVVRGRCALRMVLWTSLLFCMFVALIGRCALRVVPWIQCVFFDVSFCISFGLLIVSSGILLHSR